MTQTISLPIPPEMVADLIAEQRQKKRRPPGHIAAQRNELRLRFAAMQVRHDFRPGMLVRQKHGFGDVYDDMALLFFKWLDLNNEIEKRILQDFIDRRILMPTIDCWVMMLEGEGGATVTCLPASSAGLEPDPAGED